LAQCAGAIGEVVNIGSNTEISVGDTLNMIKDIMHSNVEFISEGTRMRPSQSEVFRLWCDNQKIHQLTGYQAQVALRDGLTKTIDWFTKAENLAKYKTGIYNV
jgi:nucleoside-diphosphate-sugar epimerase